MLLYYRHYSYAIELYRREKAQLQHRMHPTIPTPSSTTAGQTSMQHNMMGQQGFMMTPNGMMPNNMMMAAPHGMMMMNPNMAAIPMVMPTGMMPNGIMANGMMSGVMMNGGGLMPNNMLNSGMLSGGMMNTAMMNTAMMGGGMMNNGMMSSGNMMAIPLAMNMSGMNPSMNKNANVNPSSAPSIQPPNNNNNMMMMMNNMGMPTMMGYNQPNQSGNW